MSIEVETRTFEEVDEVVGLLQATRGSGQTSRVTRVMLDNMVKRDASKAEQGGVDVSMLQEVRGFSTTGSATGSSTTMLC